MDDSATLPASPVPDVVSSVSTPCFVEEVAPAGEALCKAADPSPAAADASCAADPASAARHASRAAADPSRAADPSSAADPSRAADPSSAADASRAADLSELSEMAHAHAEPGTRARWFLFSACRWILAAKSPRSQIGVLMDALCEDFKPKLSNRAKTQAWVWDRLDASKAQQKVALRIFFSEIRRFLPLAYRQTLKARQASEITKAELVRIMYKIREPRIRDIAKAVKTLALRPPSPPSAPDSE
jgi:hypothetical protein